jgi:FlaA1/EpsC-like NDP-sugar epimerase
MFKRIDFYSRTNQFLIDSCIFAAALIAAYIIRFEGWPPGPERPQFMVWLPILVAARLLVYYARGTYRLVWRFISLPDAVEIAKSISIVTLALLVLRLFLPGSISVGTLVKLPLSVIALEGLLSLTGSLSARALRRVLFTHQRRSHAAHSGKMPKRTLLYGAGRAGQLLRKELENDSDVEVVGFIDDDPKKIATKICSTRVLGGGENLPDLVVRLHVDEIVISMATASRQTLLRILSLCRKADVPAKIIPSVQELLTGQSRISQLRETRPEDLLGRESVEVPEFQQLAAPVYRGKRVLVTGAGGTIGSELVRQLVRLEPSRIAILDKDENSIYELDQELRMRNSRIFTEPQIADIRQPGRLRAIFSDFRPQVVFHAAAHKHVPLMELHPCEAVLNNVCGTKNVLEVTQEYGVERFVFISSDKAVNPVNVMGATKRIGEMLVQASVNQHRTRMACVRFGNVLGSRGSVLPLFQKQIAEGGPVTVTHPDVVRYFMTIAEAVHLILCAGTLARNGGVFVLDMGCPRNILELAHEMILLSGLQPGKDIGTTFTGLRPGEKIFEELFSPAESLNRTRFEKLSFIEPQPFDQAAFLRNIGLLVQTAENHDRLQVYEILRHMGLDFRSPVEQALAAAGD